MKVSPHFARLYYKTVRRYRKLSKRLQSQLATGQFKSKSEYAQRELLFELKKLYWRLKGFKTQLKLAMAAGVTALMLSGGSVNAQQTHMGPFTLQTRENNPLPPPINFGTNISPAAADIDNDGDVDLLSGGYGSLRFFRNTGTPAQPHLEEDSENNPFAGLVEDGDQNLAPALGDLDQDGDIDLILGTQYGGIRYYRNNGTLSSPNFELLPDWDPDNQTGNPFTALNLAESLHPAIVDFDNDGDADVLVGSNYETNFYYTSLHLYIQNDDGSFSREDISANPTIDGIRPAVIDIDDDGDFDVLTSDKYGDVVFYTNNGLVDGVWELEVTAPENDPFTEVGGGPESVPLFVDLNNDDAYDLIFGRKYGSPGIYYYQNNQDNTFTEITGLSSPFDGVGVNGHASPEFVDVDQDGLLDVIIGSDGYTDSQSVKYYRNTGNGFEEMSEEENPFNFLDVTDFSPQIVDLNGDGRLDIAGSDYDQIRVWEQQEDGTYVENTTLFSDITFTWNGFQSSRFVDIDNDGDQDLFFSDYMNYGEDYGIRFFRNTGETPSTPFFVEVTGSENPFDGFLEPNELFPTFVDYDNDGDFDAIVGEGGTAGYPYSNGANELHLFENYGTPESENLYHTFSRVLDEGENAVSPTSAFFDFDNDGDLDLFQGDYDGYISYYINENPAPVLTINTTPLESEESTGSILVDPALLLSDSDNDEMVRVVIEITNFHPNDTLTYTPGGGMCDEAATLTNVFDSDNGTLTITGRASTCYYQTILRTLTYHFDQPPVGPSSLMLKAAQAPPQKTAMLASGGPQIASVSKTIRMTIYDTDLTSGITRARAITIGTSFTPPVIADHTANVSAGKSVVIDLNALISDAQDPDASLNVSIANMTDNGADATLVGRSLTIDYSGMSFTGPDKITLQVTDTDTQEAIKDININVTNLAPTWTPQEETVVAGGIVTYDISGFYSDADDNLVSSTLTVVTQPESGAEASLTGTDLTVDYTGVPFAGSDTLEVRICDIANVCTTQELVIDVTNTQPTFNPGTDNIVAGASTTIDLSPLFGDAENNLVLSTLAVINTPASGAVATINGTDLIVDYTGIGFTGNDLVMVQICDIAGECAGADITVAVTNTSPTFANGAGTVAAGKTTSIDLSSLFNDADNNIVVSSLNVNMQPASGANATINGSSLDVDYNGVAFTGNDLIKVQVCDIAGACALADVTVTVTNVAPAFASGTSTAVAGGVASVNLLPLLTDADDNLALNSLSVVNGNTTAVYSVDGSHNLIVDYSDVTFSGNDEVTLQVCDMAAVCVQNTVTIDVTNTNPSLTADTETVGYGGVAVISLLPLITDADNNINLGSLRVVSQPASGAVASIDSNHNLVVNYAGRTFASTENILVEVCDFGGSCAQTNYAVTVSNTAPVFAADPFALEASSLTINLLDYTSDFDNNLDIASFEVIVGPQSGASATVENGQLVLDYSKVSHNGPDQLTIRFCDAVGACTESVITLTVTIESPIVVNNAVAPHGTSDANKYLHINGIAVDNNTVTIFNRWGDKVWERKNYDNVDVKFTGQNDNGNDLASGTYYFKIESIFFDGEKHIRRAKEGYLLLKQ